MKNGDLQIAPLLEIGPVAITNTVVTTWVIMLVLFLFSWLVSRRLRLEPGPLQTALEGVVSAIDDAIAGVAPEQSKQILPFIGSLWIFLVIANLTGLIPGAHSPTRDLSATAGLAFLVFLSTHWYGIRIQGIRNYLRHYLTPSPIL
ncbi:MAG: F0F1 ATP synthase subunit A, partial [Burkholderiales bacterium]